MHVGSASILQHYNITTTGFVNIRVASVVILQSLATPNCAHCLLTISYDKKGKQKVTIRKQVLFGPFPLPLPSLPLFSGTRWEGGGNGNGN